MSLSAEITTIVLLVGLFLILTVIIFCTIPCGLLWLSKELRREQSEVLARVEENRRHLLRVNRTLDDLHKRLQSKQGAVW